MEMESGEETDEGEGIQRGNQRARRSTEMEFDGGGEREAGLGLGASGGKTWEGKYIERIFQKNPFN